MSLFPLTFFYRQLEPAAAVLIGAAPMKQLGDATTHHREHINCHDITVLGWPADIWVEDGMLVSLMHVLLWYLPLSTYVSHYACTCAFVCRISVGLVV
jgi:hypothetical protein